MMTTDIMLFVQSREVELMYIAGANLVLVLCYYRSVSRNGILVIWRKKCVLSHSSLRRFVKQIHRAMSCQNKYLLRIPRCLFITSRCDAKTFSSSRGKRNARDTLPRILNVFSLSRRLSRSTIITSLELITQSRRSGTINHANLRHSRGAFGQPDVQFFFPLNHYFNFNIPRRDLCNSKIKMTIEEKIAFY